MEIEAAVFRRVKEPLTIEAVEIDKPWGREVLVRTAATGVCAASVAVALSCGASRSSTARASFDRHARRSCRG